MEGQHKAAQAREERKGREKILVLEMCWWGSEVCQPAGQAVSEEKGSLPWAIRASSPLKSSWWDFSALWQSLPSPSLPGRSRAGRDLRQVFWEQCKGHFSLAPAAETIKVAFVRAGSDKAESFHALLPSEDNSYTAGKGYLEVWHSHGAELKV